MKHKEIINKFLRIVEDVGFDLSQPQKNQILKYYNLLLVWNKKINLVSRQNTAEVLINNFVASLVFLSALNNVSVGQKKKLADFGSGGGFPGILLSIMMPEANIVLIESSRKKTLFLKKVIKELFLKAEVLNSRIEDLVLPDEEKFDFIVALAFAPLNQLVSYSGPLLNRDGAVFTLKGNNYQEEMSEKGRPNVKVVVYKTSLDWFGHSPLLKNKVLLRLEF